MLLKKYQLQQINLYQLILCRIKEGFKYTDYNPQQQIQMRLHWKIDVILEYKISSIKKKKKKKYQPCY